MKGKSMKMRAVHRNIPKKKFIVVLEIEAEYVKGSRYNKPDDWDWHSAMDMKAEESIQVLSCEEVKPNKFAYDDNCMFCVDRVKHDKKMHEKQIRLYLKWEKKKNKINKEVKSWKRNI